MNFFLKKQLTKFSYTYQPLSFGKIFKKLLKPIQSYKDRPFSAPKCPICPEQFFLVTNHYYYFHLPTGRFHEAKFFKKSYSRSSVMRMRHFRAQNRPLAPNIFWKKFLISFSSIYSPLLLCKIFKKFLQMIQSSEDAPVLAPKWPICPNDNFFRKPVNKPCFFHSFLSTCHKSKSDINLLLKY